MELGWFGNYTAEFASREYFGFGKEPGFEPLLVTRGIIQQMWAPTLHRLAGVLGVDIEDFKVVHETDSVDYRIKRVSGTVKAGTAAVVRILELQVMLSKGRRSPSSSTSTAFHVTSKRRKRIGSSLTAQGPTPTASRSTAIPSFSVEINSTSGSATICGMPAINAIPARAPPHRVCSDPWMSPAIGLAT